MSNHPTTPATAERTRQQQDAVLEYVASRGIEGAWFDGGSMLRAKGDESLRSVTEDAGINWGCGGRGGTFAYSQVRPEKFVHPEQRARQMLDECLASVEATGKLPDAENIHQIRISENGDLVTTTGHVAMKRNSEIEGLLPLFEEQFRVQYKEAMGRQLPRPKGRGLELKGSKPG